ncbi:MAG: XRE family transcriptional regulator [Candidatus Riflebacteria bacterium]|nr:XRE family transcriptional regulator [Candidatus Riflebacteria bacterium]
MATVTMDDLKNQLQKKTSRDPERALDILYADAASRTRELVLRLFESSGLQKSEIARRMGTSQPYVTALLREGIDTIGIPTLVKLLFALGYRVRLGIDKLPPYDWDKAHRPAGQERPRAGKTGPRKGSHGRTKKPSPGRRRAGS